MKNTHYWVGSFDGEWFVPDEAGQWLDGGPDFYAATAFSEKSSSASERTFVIAWMNNWNYADAVQQQGYIGQLSLVRELRLRIINGKPVLQNRPVDSVRKLFSTIIRGKEQTVSDKQSYIWPSGAERACSWIDLTMAPVNGSWPESIVMSVRGGGGHWTQLAFHPHAGVVSLDREQCGPIPKEGEAWRARRSVPCDYKESVSVSVFLDVGSIEVFLDSGASTMSALLTAPLDATAMKLTAKGGQVSISKVQIRS